MGFLVIYFLVYNYLMLQTKLLKHFFALLIVIGIFWELAEIFYFHWTIWWYDVALHFFSGFSIPMAFLVFWFFVFRSRVSSKKELIFLSLLFVLVVGILWEIFELYMQYTSFSDGDYFILDTVSDIIADLSGGFFGALYGIKFFPQISDKIDKE